MNQSSRLGLLRAGFCFFCLGVLGVALGLLGAHFELPLVARSGFVVVVASTVIGAALVAVIAAVNISQLWRQK